MDESEGRNIIIHSAQRLEALIRKHFVQGGSGIYLRDITKGVLDALPISILSVVDPSTRSTRKFDGTASEKGNFIAVANYAYCHQKQIMGGRFRVDLDEQVPLFETDDIVPVLYRHPVAYNGQQPGVVQYLAGNFVRMEGGTPLYDMGAPVFDYEAFFRSRSLRLFVCLQPRLIWQLPQRIAEIEEACEMQRGYRASRKTYPELRGVILKLQERL